MDGSVIYDGIIVVYEQSIFAIWIFIAIYFILNRKMKTNSKKADIILYFD